MPKKTDARIIEMIEEVKRQKDEITRIENPRWNTNCTFTYIEGRLNEAVNIHTEMNVRNLILMAAFLMDKELSYNRAAAELGLTPETVPPFVWNGASVKDWLDDLKKRIEKINLASRRQKLEQLETRLNAIVSPELRAKIELDSIAGEL